MSTITDIADGVATLLTAAPSGTFSKALHVARTWLPEQDLATLDSSVIVRVIPGASDETTSNRAGCECTQDVELVVMTKLDSTANVSVDPLATVLEQIRAYLRFRSPLANVRWYRTATKTVCNMASLREQCCQFTGQLALSYRYMEAAA